MPAADIDCSVRYTVVRPMFSPRRRSSSCSSWADRKSSSVSNSEAIAARCRVDRTLALVTAPLLRIASLCIVVGASSRLVLAGVRDGVDHDMRQVMIGQPVEHLAAGPLAGDHARRLEDLEMLADQRLRHAQRVDQFVDAALRLA